MKVYMVRHGESENNLNKFWTGVADVPLTEKGRTDAKKAGMLLKGISFDKVYSSDLSRAMDTARIALPEYEVETTSLLREINVGDIAEKPLAVLDVQQRADVAREGYAAYGGESKGEFIRRIQSAMHMLEDSKCETVAVFAHAGFLRRFLDEVVGVYLPRQNVRCNNCTVAIFEYTDDIWRLHSWINI